MGEGEPGTALSDRYAPPLLRAAEAAAAPGWHPKDAPGLVAPAFGSGATAMGEWLCEVGVSRVSSHEEGRPIYSRTQGSFAFGKAGFAKGETGDG